MGKDNPSFTVCMGVYHKDCPDLFLDAVRSVTLNQTVNPTEVIIVADGKLTYELEKTLQIIQSEISQVKLIRFKENRGHAAARQAGLEAASNNLIAIMDADDISVSNRFELQLKAFRDQPHAAVIGGQIKEFVDETNNVVGDRVVPGNDKDIKIFMKSRCPMNLVTVMYRKEAVQSVGGFMDWYCEEDYYLWIRLAENDYVFHNLPNNLVNVRVGKEMYQRRGGWKYFKSEAKLQLYMLKHGIISCPRYLYNILGRFAIQVAMPNKLRGFIFQKLFRQ